MLMAQDLDVDLNKLRIDRARKGRSTRSRFFNMPLLIVVLILVGIGVYAYSKSHAPVKVKTAHPQVETHHTGVSVVTASGYVIPKRRVEVSSKIIGRVKEMYVEEGQKVKAGDILIRLDDEDYAAQVRTAEAAYGVAEANLAKLRAGSRPQEIQQAKAAVDSAQATYDQAKLNFARIEKLLKDKVISQQEYDQGKASYDVATANLQAARKASELVVIGPRKEDIDSAEAAVRQAKANLDFAQTQLSYTVIAAPIDGTILEKLAEKGELVTNINFGGTRGAKSAVVSMANLKDLQVEIDMNENDLGKIHHGQQAEIRLDVNPEEFLKGQVEEIAPEADRQKGTVQVKVRFVTLADFVKPEMNAQVTFLADDKDGQMPSNGPVIWIPAAAVVKKERGKTVYIARDGKAIEQAVKTGLEGEKGVQVLEGLKGNESVITEPLDQLEQDTRITTGTK